MMSRLMRVEPVAFANGSEPYVPRQENSKMVVSVFVVQGIQRVHPEREAKHRLSCHRNSYQAEGI